MIKLPEGLLNWMPDDCWEWEGSKNNAGYGILYGKLTHRLVWELFNGKIPKNMCVLHSCDNPPCVNPNHLSLGTREDNMKDRKKKGRNCIALNFSVEEIRDIRDRCSKEDYRRVAAMFGVEPNLIWKIWKLTVRLDAL